MKAFVHLDGFLNKRLILLCAVIPICNRLVHCYCVTWKRKRCESGFEKNWTLRNFDSIFWNTRILFILTGPPCSKCKKIMVIKCKCWLCIYLNFTDLMRMTLKIVNFMYILRMLFLFSRDWCCLTFNNVS